jgi:hypothetical protein
MADKVQLLWFAQERPDEEDIELLIGVYRTSAETNAAIERLKGKPGFAAFPEGFAAVWYELNQDHWTEGFVEV